MAKTKKPKAFWRQLGFQLNQNDVADNHRIEIIDWLKKSRHYNTLLRDALDIVYALRYNNDVSLLLKHFPNISELIKVDGEPILQAIYNRQQEILKRLNELEANGISTQAVTTGKSISMSKIAMPLFDDEDTVVINQDLTNDPAKNFLASFSRLGGDNGDTKKD